MKPKYKINAKLQDELDRLEISESRGLVRPYDNWKELMRKNVFGTTVLETTVAYAESAMIGWASRD